MNKAFVVISFFVTNISFSQVQRIDNLVFEGAGIRGLAYCGVIKVLEENQTLQQVKRIAGTSAGAITALLVSLQYSAKEIEQIIGSTNFRKFNDGGIPFWGGLHRLRKGYGWYKGEKFEKLIGNLIAQKTGDANISFATLAEQYKPIYITGTSLNEQKAILFSAEHFPNMAVRDAIRISMSIPLYYKAVLMDDSGKVYKKPIQGKNLHIMVDGGFMDNFPIKIFDSSKYVESDTINHFKVNPYTIGCRIDSKAQVDLDQNPSNNFLAKHHIKNLSSYFNAFLVLNMERLSRQQIALADWQRTISIEDGGVGPKVRAMPQQQINLLVNNGVSATKKYFTKR